MSDSETLRFVSPADVKHNRGFSSALVYLYSGLRSGASADEVLAPVERRGWCRGWPSSVNGRGH
jgi:hypothetical protein